MRYDFQLSINNIMNLNDILNESYFGDLYHYAPLRNALQIVRTNTLNTTPFMSYDGDLPHFNEKHYFYVSFARSKRGSYHQAALDSFNLVLFVLDGDRLSENFKLSPVDYWGHSITKGDPEEDEMEERIFTNKPYIKNISRYIKHVDLVVPHISSLKLGRYRTFLENCKKIDVKVRVYVDVQDFYNNKNYIDGTSEKILSKDDFDSSAYKDYEPFDADSIPHVKFLYNLLVGAPNNSAINDNQEIKNIYGSLVDSNFSSNNGQKSRLFNYIKNVLKSTLPDSREYIGKIISSLRSKKIRNIDEFVDYLIEKYNKRSKENSAKTGYS
jgi:hypothetical protein